MAGEPQQDAQQGSLQDSSPADGAGVWRPQGIPAQRHAGVGSHSGNGQGEVSIETSRVGQTQGG